MLLHPDAIDALGGPAAVADLLVEAIKADHAKAVASDRAHVRTLVATVLAERLGLNAAKYETVFGSDDIDMLTDRVLDLPKSFLPGDPRRHPTYLPSLDEVRAYVDRVHP